MWGSVKKNRLTDLKSHCAPGEVSNKKSKQANHCADEPESKRYCEIWRNWILISGVLKAIKIKRSENGPGCSWFQKR